METWNDEYRMGEPAAVYQVAEVKERVNPETPLLEKGDEIIDMGADFDFDGFQVVRREFFAHLAEPAVTFNNCRFYVNSAQLCTGAGQSEHEDHGSASMCRKREGLLCLVQYKQGQEETQTDHMQTVLCQDCLSHGMESRLSV